MIEQLKDYLDKDVKDLQTLLPEVGYEIAYGDNYSLSEIRKAVCTDKLPVYAKLNNGRTVLFVGENKQNQLVVQDKDGNLFNSEDKTLNKAWTGNVVIVTNKNDKLMKGETNSPETPHTPKEPDDMVLFNPMMNSWDYEHDERRQSVLKEIRDIKYLNECYLPEHPVIVYFKKPTAQELKATIRSYTKGVEICVLDPSDPYTEFLHEFGHVYWSNRLTKEDKEMFKELHSDLHKDNLPPVLMDSWSWENPEELFATIYFWYIKGLQKNPGYLKILEVTYNAAKVLMESIFERIAMELKNLREVEIRNNELMEEWGANERDIVLHLNQVMGKATKLNVSGKIIKAKSMPHKLNFGRLILPSKLDTTVLGEYKNRKWHHVNSGILKGRVIVTKGSDVVDFNYMETKRKYHLVPVPSLMKSNGRSYQGVSYIKPETCLQRLQEATVETLIVKSELTLVERVMAKFWG